MMLDSEKLSRKFLINFSVITNTKLWSLDYLKVDFYNNNKKKKKKKEIRKKLMFNSYSS